ncbi:PhnD/SsuA/transferrin family substrate-binding protein [Thalassobaculum sp. OXR-137]|uniref:PhnD/SsuA/transferrin family substrate-binding protein n=1 Tax=Thalassobaculum sp. OXR-137 TaxID=3100173 RepID=UPI002AC94645|nr:PhnD/SsuA/transferrin family substrate-binding protein [Thalassobaculum sp. OXR-137]WPZ33663.1 PhnD/SsuA/transferrin family substrate-binding protein [Thalassobaculum sp. OXR-137]
MKLRALLAAAALAVAVPSLAVPSPASAADSLKIAVTDIEGLEALQSEFGPFEDALEKSTGLDIELFPVGSRTAAVEAINAGQVDLVLTGPAEYVVIKELTDAKIVVGWQRPDYFAQVVALADGPIRRVADLKGKSVAFGSVGSTSQHLGPAQALTDLGLVYGQDYEPKIISRNVAVEALICGDIAAIGMNYSHLQRAREAYPDVAFTVVARGRDLPNDILVARADADPAAIDKVRKAFVDNGKSLLAAVLKGEDNQKYKGGFFLATVEDSDYDYVRSMYKTIGVDGFKSFVGN